MKRLILPLCIGALFAGIFTVGVIWSKVTPVHPVETTDSSSTPDVNVQGR